MNDARHYLLMEVGCLLELAECNRFLGIADQTAYRRFTLSELHAFGVSAVTRAYKFQLEQE
ncbi:MAG: hypothetical protein JRN20_04765 [Nitrososphaerota archaeon]|nr:hypothetical protein [Nitrososphaerota archaeon]MDG6924344.1 hypothetical protein [Nitrososphaerota archaeon]